MKKRRKFKKQRYYLHSADRSKKLFNSYAQIAEYIGTTQPRVRYAYMNKRNLDGYIITKKSAIRYSAYKPMRQRILDKQTYRYAKKRITKNHFYDESEKFSRIQRQFIGFDSYTGIDAKSVQRYKPIYVLTEDEAVEQGLQEIFSGGSLYIDKGKRIYKKDADKYYQLTFPQIIVKQFI